MIDKKAMKEAKDLIRASIPETFEPTEKVYALFEVAMELSDGSENFERFLEEAFREVFNFKDMFASSIEAHH